MESAPWAFFPFTITAGILPPLRPQACPSVSRPACCCCRRQVVGMGLLLSFIGLHTSNVVVPDPDTMVAMGDLLTLEPLLAIAGLAAIAALHYRNVRGSIIIGVLLTAVAYFVAKGSWPTE
jgi:hypothetical protein